MPEAAPPSTLDPKLDIVFKKLLTAEANRELLVHFLSAVLEPPAPITQVEVLDPETRTEDVSERRGAVDLLLWLDDGSRAHVEMQKYTELCFVPRALFYWSRIFSTQLERGQDFTALAPTFGIFLLDYDALPGYRYHSVFELSEVHDHSPLSDLLRLHFLELRKLPEPSPPGDAADSHSDVVGWGRFFAASSDEEREILAMSNPILRKAKTALDDLSRDALLREKARWRELEILYRKKQIQIAEAQAKARGEAEGRAEGEAKGRVEGEAKGRVEGNLEGQRALLLRQLQLKFGALDTPRLQRLGSATETELAFWADRVLTARSLEEVFEPKPND